MKKLAILQSNYIPWKGYFDIIGCVDEFIIYDDMQFTKNDWRNRNKIKTPNGLEWITVPVGQNISRRIRDVTLPGAQWQEKHWKTLRANYSRSPHFEEVSAWLQPLYAKEYETLTEVNRTFIEEICKYLGIRTEIKYSWDYALGEGKTERLVDLCVQAGAKQYVSGPAARDYMNLELFNSAGVEVKWMDYSGYPEYTQQWGGGFQHGVSIVDLLFNCGKEAPKYMKFSSACV